MWYVYIYNGKKNITNFINNNFSRKALRENERREENSSVFSVERRMSGKIIKGPLIFITTDS